MEDQNAAVDEGWGSQEQVKGGYCAKEKSRVVSLGCSWSSAYDELGRESRKRGVGKEKELGVKARRE